jgi:hypothetical protein
MPATFELLVDLAQLRPHPLGDRDAPQPGFRSSASI